MAWSLAVTPHILDPMLDNKVPAIRIVVLVPSSLLSFLPLIIVSFDKKPKTL